MTVTHPAREGYGAFLRDDVETVVERLDAEGFTVEGELLMPVSRGDFGHGYAEYVSARVRAVDARGDLGRCYLRVTSVPPEVASTFDAEPILTFHSALGTFSSTVEGKSLRRTLSRVRRGESFSPASPPPSNESLARTYAAALTGPLAAGLGDVKRLRELVGGGRSGSRPTLVRVLGLSDSATVADVELATTVLADLASGAPLEWALRRGGADS